MLAMGLVILSLTRGITIDIVGYLFGDILAVSQTDLLRIGGLSLFILGALLLLWKPLLTVLINQDLAQTEGVNVRLTRIMFILLLAILIAMMIQIVGVLLVASLLLLPSMTARRLAKTPEHMAIFAALYGTLSVIGGLYASLYLDSPAGPSIVVIALTGLIATYSLVR